MPIYSDVIARLDEKAVQSVIKDLESQFQSGAGNLGQAFSQAFTSATSNFGEGLQSSIRQTIGEMGTLGKAAESAMGVIPLRAAAAATGIGLIAVAAVQVGQALYDVGSRFDAVADRMAVRTNSIGDQMDALNNSMREAFRNSSSSLEEIGDVLGRVSQSLNLTGQPLTDMTRQIADLNRMTGESINIRNFGRVLAQFGIDAGQAGATLDALYSASAATGAPINELVTNLSNAGPAARTLGLSLGELTYLFGRFEEGGIDAGRAQQALNNAAKVFADSGIDMQTGLADTVTQLQGFISAGNEAAAVDLAGKVFGERGAQRFVDLIRQGRLTVGDLNTELSGTAGAIDKQNEATRDWAENWAQLKNRVTDLAQTIGGPLFDALNASLGVLNDLLAPAYGGENMTTGPGMVASQPFTPGALMPGVPLPGAPAPTGGAVDRGRLSAQLPFLGGVIGLPEAGPGAPQDIAAAVAAGGGGGGAGSAPAVPYPAGYGQPPAPGETVEQWQRRMQIMDAQHDVAEKQAALNQLESSNTADQNAIITARNNLVQAQMREFQVQNQQAAAQQAQAAQVPFPTGYGAAPRPGQSSQSYAAEQAVYEAQQKRAEAAARLAQVEADAATTAEDLIEARNNLAKAEGDEHQAQMRLAESASEATGQLAEVGMQLDADFGFSKGLPGIVENITKMLAGFAAAPVIGALSGVQAGFGYNPGEAGSGLVGIMAASGAFGDQYTRRSAAPPSAASGNLIPPYNPAITLPRAASGAALGGGSYPGDAALLAMVPKGGRYDASGDLAQGLADCTSGIEDLVNILDGRPTAGRSMATGNAAEWLTSRGFLPGYMPGAFNVGFNSGHMEATLPDGTPVNFGSDSAVASGGVAGAVGAADPSFTSRYYRPVTGGIPARGASVGSVMLGGQSIPLPLPVTIVGGAGGAIPSLPGLPAAAAPSSPSGAGAATPAPGTPGRAGTAAPAAGAAASGASGGGAYLPITPEQLTNPGLLTPTPAGGGASGGGGIASQLFPGLTGAPQSGGGARGGGTGTGGLFPGLAGPPQALGGGIGLPAPGGGPSAGTTLIGGLAPPEGTGSGFGGISGGILGAAMSAASSGAGMAASMAAGGMDGGAGGAAASAATQIGIQLLNRAIQQGGQVAGIAASGVIETLLPFGASELAQNNWLTKIVGGIVGARPVLPNLAGGGKKTPEGLTPEQAAQMEQGQGGPTPEQVAGKPTGGAGGVVNNYNTTNNTTLNTASDTVRGNAQDWEYHGANMNAGPGQ